MLSGIVEKLKNNDVEQGIQEFNAFLGEYENGNCDIPIDELKQVLDLTLPAAKDFISSNKLPAAQLATFWLYYIKMINFPVISNKAKLFPEIKEWQKSCLEVIKTIGQLVNIQELFDAVKKEPEDFFNVTAHDVKNEEPEKTHSSKDNKISSCAILRSDILLKLMSNFDEDELKKRLIAFFFMNLVCAATYAKTEDKEKFADHFGQLWKHLLTILENDKSFYSRKTFSLVPSVTTPPSFPKLAAMLVCLIYQTNYALLGVEFNMGYRLNRNKEFLLDLSSPQDRFKGEIIRKIENNEMFDFILPLETMFLELATLTTEISADTYETFYQQYSDSKTANFEGVGLNAQQLQPAIKLLLANFKKLINGLHISFELKKEYELHELHNEVMASIEKAATEELRHKGAVHVDGITYNHKTAQHLTYNINKPTRSVSERELFVNMTHLNCFSLLPFLIIAYNHKIKFNADELNLINKFNRILFKFALLSNSHYEEKFLNQDDLDEIEYSCFTRYARRSKDLLVNVIATMNAIFDGYENIDITTLDTHLNKLDMQVEAVYKDIGYRSISAAHWLKNFTKDEVNLFNDAQDLYITFKQNIHKDIFVEQLNALQSPQNNQATFTIANDTIIIHDFRRSEYFRTTALETACFRSLRQMKNNKKAADECPVLVAAGPVMYIQEEEKHQPILRQKSSKPSRDSKTKTVQAQIKEKNRDKNLEKTQKDILKKEKQRQREAEKAAKLLARQQASTENNNHNNQVMPTANSADVTTTALPQTIEIVNFGKENDRPQFQRPIKKDIPKFGFSLNHHLQQLDSAFNEIKNDHDTANNLSMRYFVLYHGIRMLEAALLVANTMGIKQNSELYHQMLSLRNVLTDRMDYFLDPNETDKDFFSSDMDYTSIFCKLESIAFRLQCFYTTERPMPIVLTTNPIYQKLCPNAARNNFAVIDPPSVKMHGLLTSIKEKCNDRLKLYLGKTQYAHELQDPFIAATVKMLLCEIGGLVRRIRNDHSELVGKLMTTDLLFDSYPDEFTLEESSDNKQKNKNKKPKKRILPFLKSKGSSDVASILDKLEIGDFLTLLIEVRNRVGHDDKLKEEQDFPEEITIELIYDIAKHLFAERYKKNSRMEELDNLISKLTPEDKLKLNYNAKTFTPMLYGNTPAFQPKQPMSASSNLFTPKNADMPTLFNSNNQTPNQQGMQQTSSANEDAQKKQIQPH